MQTKRDDLRHHFVCKNILKCLSNNGDIMAKLLYFMIFMGHSNIENRYYYIHLISDFLPKYNDFSLLNNELVPEVEENKI